MANVTDKNLVAVAASAWHSFLKMGKKKLQNLANKDIVSIVFRCR